MGHEAAGTVRESINHGFTLPGAGKVARQTARPRQGQ
jgi:hypothetical protein